MGIRTSRVVLGVSETHLAYDHELIQSLAGQIPLSFDMASMCEKQLDQPCTAAHEKSTEVAEAREPQVSSSSMLLLAILVLLGSRLAPELEAARDALMLSLPLEQRILTLLGAAILEDSQLYTSMPGRALFAGVFEERWVNVRGSTFRDRSRMMLILKAVDPQGTVWPHLIDCDEAEWLENGDCAHLVRAALAKFGIEYELSTHFINIDVAQLIQSLARSSLLASAVLPSHQLDSLYHSLFTPALLASIHEAAARMEVEGDMVVNENVLVREDLMAGVKLLAMSVSLFLGAGLFIGSTMSGRVTL